MTTCGSREAAGQARHLVKLEKLIIVEFFADNGVQAITPRIIIGIEILENIDVL